MVEVGGKQLNEAIISMVRRNCNLNIGERSATRLKLSLSYLKDDPQEVRKVVGVDWITGLPQAGVITSDMVNEAIEEPFLKICEEIRFFLDRIPPQIYSNIADEGVFLVGGTTKIPGVGWFISQEVRIRVRLSKYHDLCTIYGIKEIIEKIRPFLINDGGDVEFVKFENGTAYVKMVGNCANCLYSDLTMSETIETILTSEIPEVIKVEEYRD